MLFSLDFHNNTMLSWLFFFFLVIDVYFLIPAAIEQIFNPITELVIPVRIPSKDVKADIDIQPVIVEAKVGKRSI